MILKIGHQGASGYEPENTLRSFKKAISLGVEMVELDVRLCKTGELVVIHDKKVERTTKGRGRVKGMSLAELKKLDAGKGEEIPTLEEVLELIKRRVRVNIELKGRGTAKPVAEVIERYVKEKGWKEEDFMVSSFSYKELKDLRKLNSSVKIGVLLEKWFFRYKRRAKRLKAYSINLPKDYVNKERIERIHQKGWKVLVWTVDEKEEIEKMKRMGVDGLFSNYPDRI